MIKINKFKIFLENLVACSFVYVMILAAWFMNIPEIPIILISLLAIGSSILISIACIPIRTKRMLQDVHWLSRYIRSEIEPYRSIINNSILDEAEKLLDTLINLDTKESCQIVLDEFPTFIQGIQENKLDDCRHALHNIKIKLG